MLSQRLVFSIVFILIAGLGFTKSSSGQSYRSIDGHGNNLNNPTWGAADEPLLRTAPPGYSDGVSAPAGPNRPSPRLVSNLLCAQEVLMINGLQASDFLWQWGQFIDHDISLTETQTESFPIPVPLGDPFFDPFGTGTAVIELNRSNFVEVAGVREQLNEITAYIDGSSVYGSNSTRAAALRTLDGTGRLKTSPGDLLPFNVDGLPNAEQAFLPSEAFFLAGDVRANEQVGLAALHTLFVREHNRLAGEIAANQPGLSGDEIYEEARRRVAALLQVVTYQEFLPILLGPNALSPYAGYDPTVDAQVANEFSTVAYRVGHTMLASVLLRYNSGGVPNQFGNLPLRDAFFNPLRITDEGGIEGVLRGLAAKGAQEIDPFVIDDVRNFLFGPPGSGGFDLASLNIQRGRDHGIADYNSLRVAYGLPAKSSFADITPDPNLQAAFAAAYDSVDEIDAWIGALAEPHLPGSMVGELNFVIIKDQFERFRDGDRFWYQNDLSPAEQIEVESTTLADIIRRNSDITGIADNVFVLPRFRRGDINQDAVIDFSDVVASLEYLFTDGEPVQCEKACDTDDSGLLDLADPIFLLDHLFGSGPVLAAPSPTCDWELSADALGCYQSSCQ